LIENLLALESPKELAEDVKAFFSSLSKSKL